MLLGLLLACASLHARAGTWVLDAATSGQPLGRQMAWLEDPAGTLTLADVLARAADFQPSTKPAPNFGFTKSVYWFTLRLENRDAADTRWILEHGYPHVDHLDFYVMRDGALLSTNHTGRALPFEQRAIKHRNFTLPLDVARGEHLDLYIRVQADGSLQMPMAAWAADALAVKDHEEQLALGIYYGVLVAMFVFNAMVWLSIRVRSYLHYLHYIGGYIAFQLALNGLAYEYLWPALPRWNAIALPLFIAFALQGMVNFARSFLSVSHHLPRMGRLLQWQSWMLCAMWLAAPFAPYSLLIKLSTLNALLAVVLIMIVSTACLVRGVKEARYFLLAWVTLLVGIAIYTFKTFNILPTNFVTEYGLQIGSAFETVLLSFALAHRMKILAEENRRIQAEAKTDLERRVSQRTADLDRALKDLSDANRELKRINAQDGLTCAKNRKYFDEQLSSEIKRASRARLPMSVLMIDVDHFKQVNDTHGHLAGDECLRSVAETIRQCLQRPGDELARYGGEEFAVVLPNTDRTGVLHMAERIRAAIAGLKLRFAGQDIPLTVSIGTCTLLQYKVTPDKLLAAVDAALYKAKHDGRNCVREAALEDRVEVAGVS